jgi:hypothetical protein
MIHIVTLGGIEVACLPLDPRFMDSNAAEDDGFLRAIKICNMTCFEGEVKLSAQCCKFMAC